MTLGGEGVHLAFGRSIAGAAGMYILPWGKPMMYFACSSAQEVFILHQGGAFYFGMYAWLLAGAYVGPWWGYVM